MIYCQSKLRLSRPSPSLPSAPPKILVNTFWVFVDAFCDARQKTLTEFKSGKMYAGMIS